MHNQIVMKPCSDQQHLVELACSEDMLPSALTAMPGRLVTVTFRGSKVRVLADHDRAAQRARNVAPHPVTDAFHLELLTGTEEAPDWPRPVVLQAVIEARCDPLAAVQRASRWASYGARLALVIDERLTDQALIEAELRGVWVIAMNRAHGSRVAVAGQRGPAEGSMRGLGHRLLDELTWSELDVSRPVTAVGATPAATR